MIFYNFNRPYGHPLGSGYTVPERQDKSYIKDFCNPNTRRSFIRKVYSLLMVHLLVTLGVISVFLYNGPTRQYVQSKPGLFEMAVIVLIVSTIVLACCGELRRNCPLNFVLLLFFAVTETVTLGVAASTYQSVEVAFAVGITAAVCLGVTLFSIQSKWDFTVLRGILIVTVIILFLIGVVATFNRSKIVSLTYASIGVFVFCVYLICDTQLMLLGGHMYPILPDEYIFATLNLYTDIIAIFIYVLIRATRLTKITAVCT